MIGLFIGIIFLILTGFLSVRMESIPLYWQWHSFALVGIGTVAIFFLTTPLKTLKNLFSYFLEIYKPDESLLNYASDILSLAKNRFQRTQSTQPLINYAEQLWEKGVDHDLFIVLLSEKRNELESKATEVIHSIKNLSKYPPALGMLGTVMGMIDLFSALDQNHDKIGSSLSIAMTATLFGLVLANFIISPMADRFHVFNIKEQKLTTTVYEILLLINSEQPLALIDEEIKTRAS